MIKIFLIGRLGKDCSTNNVSGNNVINFTVAHSERYKDRSGSFQERTIWADCSYWTEKTGVVPYLVKGKQVYVEGTPDVRAYTTNDGKHGASLTIRVHSVQLLDTKSSESEGQASNATSVGLDDSTQTNEKKPPSDDGASVDDLPF